MILMLIGLTIMTIGMGRAIVENRFQVKLHFIGLADIVGTIFVLFGLIIEKIADFELILSLLFLMIWSPYLTHMIMKAYISRMGKR